MSNEEIRIRLKSFDHKLLDRAAKLIRECVSLAGGSIKGPIPMPRHIMKFTVNRSPHIDKKSREQFEIRTYTALIMIDRPTPQIIDTLMKLDLSSGVDVEIKT